MRDYKNIKGLSKKQELQRIKGALRSFIFSGNYSTAKEALEAFVSKNQSKCEPGVLLNNLIPLLKVSQDQMVKVTTRKGLNGSKPAKSVGFKLVQGITLEEWKAKHPPSLKANNPKEGVSYASYE